MSSKSTAKKAPEQKPEAEANPMDVSVPVEELRKRSIFLASPMYGGMCNGIYAKSLADTMVLFHAYGIKAQLHLLFNESLITRARAYCAQSFLDSDCTHLMFIDSDIGWNAQDVLSLLALASDESPYDVICGPYPKKCISWEKVKAATDKGFADDDPNVLQNFIGDYVFNVVGNTPEIQLNRPVEVQESGTGFMMIKRKTLLDFQKNHPEKMYKPDHVRSEGFDGSREICMSFDCVIDPVSKRYLSEDYYFCQEVRKFGGKVWLCPWINLTHTGAMVFGGSLMDLARLGASATADPSALGGHHVKNRSKK